MSQATLPLVVTAVTAETADVIAVDLADPLGADLPEWEPGAHIDLHLPSGLIRQYSLCGRPEDRKHYRVGILRSDDGRGGSVEAHGVLKPGVALTASAPRNHFRLEAAPSYLFIGGGIGITPMIPMIRAAMAAGKRWSLVYGGRSRDSMAFLSEIAGLPAGSVTLVPQDELGFIDLDGLVAGLDAETLVYSCGPAPMLSALEARMEGAGIRPRLHLERFAADPSAAAPAAEAVAGYEVELRASGKTLTVPPGGRLREALVAAGIPVPFSCEEGYCGSCETVVLEGIPDHHDVVLTPEERATNTLMMVCVGGCKSQRLVLDL